MIKLFFSLFVLGLVVPFLRLWRLILCVFLLAFLIFIFFIPLCYISRVTRSIYVDSLSFFLIVLSFWIVGLIFLAREGIYEAEEFKGSFKVNLIFLLIFLGYTFFSNRLLLFYFFWNKINPYIFFDLRVRQTTRAPSSRGLLNILYIICISTFVNRGILS